MKNEVGMLWKYANGKFVVFQGAFNCNCTGGSVIDEQGNVGEGIAVRSSLAECDDESHVKELMQNLIDESRLTKPTGTAAFFGWKWKTIEFGFQSARRLWLPCRPTPLSANSSTIFPN